jgi:hypothetical protein
MNNDVPLEEIEAQVSQDKDTSLKALLFDGATCLQEEELD